MHILYIPRNIHQKRIARVDLHLGLGFRITKTIKMDRDWTGKSVVKVFARGGIDQIRSGFVRTVVHSYLNKY